MAKKNVWEINFAKNRAVRERAESYFIPRTRDIRYQRRALEDDWMRFFNMWMVVKDGFHNYTGRANLYVPEVRKNVEAQARQLVEAAFPQDDFFDVSPGMTGTKRGAEAWKAIHKWAMDKCQIRIKYHIAMRQQCLLGTSPIYLPWTKKTRKQFLNLRTGKARKLEASRKLMELFNGPDFLPRDLFKWYAMNPKKSDFQEDGCFEDFVLLEKDILRREKEGFLANRRDIDATSGNAYAKEELERDVERMEAMGLTIDPAQGYSGEASIAGALDDEDRSRDATTLCTKIYTDWVLPEACEEDEDPELPIPVVIELYNNSVAGRVMRNDHYHQMAPYVVGKYILPNADEFYGQGIPQAIQYMQYELNSKSEQCMDSTTLALNPISIIDPGLAGSGEEFNVEPGAKWFANPAGVKLTAIPDVSPVGYQAMSQIMARMQDYSDRSPALPPQLMGKSRTATQSQIVENSLSTDNKTFQIQNELLVLEQTLDQWEFLVNQHMEDEQIIMLLGRRASDLKRTMVNKADLIGRYSYRWKAASTLQNRAMLGRQMLDAFKTAMMLPPPVLQKLNFDFAEFFKMLWDMCWQLPDGDKIIGTPEELVTQDAQAENKLASLGAEIEVLPGDDDKAHIAIHDQGITKAKNDQEKQTLMLHVMEHQKQAQTKQAAAQAAQQQQQMQMAMLQAQGGGGQGQGGPRRSPGSGNRTQQSPMASHGDMASGVRA